MQPVAFSANLIRHLAERFCCFDKLVRPGTNPVVFRQVHPPDGPRRIHQKLGRPCNVTALFSCAGMNQVVTANHLRLRVGKKSVGVAGLLTKIARDLGSVYAYRYGANPSLFYLL